MQAAVLFVVDSTGLKIFGEDEWLEEKHKTKRKLHLGLDQVDGAVALFLGEGGYDCEPTFDLLAAWFGAMLLERGGAH